MNTNTPIPYSTAKAAIDSFRIPDFAGATIRDIVNIANKIEQETGESFVRLEIGSPGFPPENIGKQAELQAIERGVSSQYPPLHGIEPLKSAASRFIKAFVNVDISARSCIPTSGSMQACCAAFMACGQCDPDRNRILFIDPGFPVQKLQATMLGMPFDSFDTYSYRGGKLAGKIEEYLSSGRYCAMLYSNPNNPSWACLTDSELQQIGALSRKYDVIVIEDLAYFGMDFRQDITRPYEPPFQPSVAHYTDLYMLMISGSKAFSYAGQRIAVAAISDTLFERSYPGLQQRYGVGAFGTVYVNRILYALTAGTAHSAQYALAAMLDAAVKGEYNFLHDVYEYGRRAKKLKEIFLANGFHLVYDKDIDQPVGDGFYFTIGYPGKTGVQLMYELLFYGVSAIALNSTGSTQEGLRICTSFVRAEQYGLLEQRMKQFNENNKQ
ncbi:MAG: pyridoxal phosphate-dependent aminotransferase [Paludibacteraceae bacterium]|nr:pyridoxal phosphate-dependent aminotransferase [Paludibacteraceae bacterium]